MKEIKAYIKPHKLDEVVRALHGFDGLTGMSFAEVSGFGRGHKKVTDVTEFQQHLRIEIACRDDSADRIVEIIRKTAHTGLRGDGKIYVAEISHAVRISTGEIGEPAV